MDIKEIIEEAKKRYPKGCIIDNRGIIPHVNGTKVVNGKPRKDFNTENSVVVDCKDGGYYTIWRDGIWADIVKYPEGYSSIDNLLIFN